MKNKKILLIIPVVLLILAGGIFGIIKYRESQQQLNLQEMQVESHVFDDIDVEEPENKINFDKLRKSNEDIIAWIEVPGTDVNYPIVQSGEDMEDDFYLTHNLDGSGGYPGGIYIQKVNNADFNDSVTVVYGHDMKDGTMFHTLHDFEDLKFFEENTEFYVYTPEEKKTYRIVAATTYDDRLIPAYYNDFASDMDVLGFIGSVFLQDANMTNHFYGGDLVDESDHYVVLSTCTKRDDTRWLVVGVLESDL